MSDSDRQALRLAQDLREEIRAVLPRVAAAPSVSPFVDQSGMPSVLLKMDAETARALMAVLAERRGAPGAPPQREPRRADGSHVPPPSQPPPFPQAAPTAGPEMPGMSPFGGPAHPEPVRQPAYPEPAYPEPAYPEPAYTGPGYAQQTGVYGGGTGPTPFVPSVYHQAR
ncbi:hypothetical protein [Spirillospora albida]|uniref:hypothetical protein n=1 Tax=Spirillospora albida TaxID=58123 RepID=UPI0012FA0E27|nr:hypothetical protein [Spirillospora albida]